MGKWLLSVTAAAVLSALAGALTPQCPARLAARLAAGAAVALTLALPLTAPLPELSLPQLPQGGEAAAEVDDQRLLKALIAEKTGAYILDKGRDMGLITRVSVTVVSDGSAWPVPWQAELWGRWTAAERAALSGLLDRELDIPPQRQTFWEEGA